QNASRSFATLRISAAGSDARKTPQDPSLRSGFRLRAQTPAKRLKILRCAQDFGCGLRRPQNASRSFAALRISAAGSDARKTPHVGYEFPAPRAFGYCWMRHIAVDGEGLPK